MAEWQVFQGIGEHRALLMDHGRAIAAKVDWPGELVPGQVAEVKLVHRQRGSTRGSVQFDSGEKAWVDRLPRDASEGARLRVEVVRAPIGEVGRAKPALVRPTSAEPRPAPSLAERLGAKVVQSFDSAEWSEFWWTAWSGRHSFAGGELVFSPTPAMTLVDVDGDLPPRALAMAAVEPLAEAIRLLDLSGSIGVDFPTLASKADRKAVDAALEDAFAGWPHERTAMNGFGFVQIVARREAPSLLERVQNDPVGAVARLAVNHAAAMNGPGITLITAHPAVIAALRADWLEQLYLKTARPVELRAAPEVALEGWHTQIVGP
ncbi:ribonuclease E/G [Aurantiacibacter luteus]|uniref:RNA-binding protein AU-1/Ribonuclease E/G domain-containing protein n=1 Tax=Aurantiacibacter luteus TaxID=1581420 RepID=A0A0G9MWK4_9SPHN|nr:ribonuclease E/G [Aurantiacibacter luteus]KLE35132.1 hypothetical protein AAW00_01205 [Aurantiacibacter luteus]